MTRSLPRSSDEAGIEYFYTLIDDAVARVMKVQRAATSGHARTMTETL